MSEEHEFPTVEIDGESFEITSVSIPNLPERGEEPVFGVSEYQFSIQFHLDEESARALSQKFEVPFAVTE